MRAEGTRGASPRASPRVRDPPMLHRSSSLRRPCARAPSQSRRARTRRSGMAPRRLAPLAPRFVQGAVAAPRRHVAAEPIRRPSPPRPARCRYRVRVRSSLRSMPKVRQATMAHQTPVPASAEALTARVAFVTHRGLPCRLGAAQPWVARCSAPKHPGPARRSGSQWTCAIPVHRGPVDPPKCLRRWRRQQRAQRRSRSMAGGGSKGKAS